MVEPGTPLPDLVAKSHDPGEFWREPPGGCWATAAVVLLLLSWHFLRLLSRRRRLALAGDPSLTPAPVASSYLSSPAGITVLISEADLRDLVISLEWKLKEERWENVIEKKNDQISYKAKCCRPKDGPLKYHSVTIFEKCSTELLRDFYMDNEFRGEWDKTVIQHEQLQVDESSGTEIGRTIKKFPLLTPREYILAWRVWEGKDKSFYCFIKDCEHPLAPRHKKYVRVVFFRSGWRIRKVPCRDACEITMVHQEDAGLNVEMAKLAFAKGIWSYVSKMNSALRQYSSTSCKHSMSVITLPRLIQKISPDLESDPGTSHQGLTRSLESDFERQAVKDASEEKLARKFSMKWIANGLLLLGGIACLSKGRSSLGTQLAMALILKKLVEPGSKSGKVETTKLRQVRRGSWN